MDKNLPELIEQFLEYLEVERGVSRLTIRDYRLYLKRFIDWLEKISPSPSPADINLDNVRRYRLYLAHFTDHKGLPLKRVTQNYYVICLRSFLRYLIKNDYTTLSPDKIDLPKTESRSLKFLDKDQVVRLLNGPTISDDAGLRDKAILETLFSTGLRVAELVKLNRDQLNFETKEIGIIGKGGRARVVFLSNSAIEWLKRYLEIRKDDFKPLFIRYSGAADETNKGEKMRLTSRSVQRLLEKYVLKMKLPVKATPHVLRHSLATDLLINGADIRSVQEILGHKNITTTQIYTHVTNARLKEIHEKFHSSI